MEDDAPVIYGLEFQARALTPQTAETDAIRFLVGTQSLKYDNQIHIVDFDDENNIISKNVLLHQVGEIWHISTSPADKGVLATCYNKPSDSKVLTCAAVWRMPKELEPGGHESPDDSTSPAHTLELLCHLDNTAHGSMACVAWEPAGDGKKVISLADSHILLWDLQESSSQAVLASSASLEGKGQLKFTSGRWSPHHTGTQVATANDTTIRGWDTRSMSQIYCIENAHGQLVRDLDFNPNKQYYLASCGDDCKVKFWDTRNVAEPVKTLEQHSHWKEEKHRPYVLLQLCQYVCANSEHRGSCSIVGHAAEWETALMPIGRARARSVCGDGAVGGEDTSSVWGADAAQEQLSLLTRHVLFTACWVLALTQVRVQSGPVCLV
ncbi:EARP and GARP complex-interacting protein 1 isoform X2 [Mustela nigripes]|uniref:EARP and GARP complex-interacting protein 1 isoform X2 n=1 Tax=Mustela nigripes TaxID=77151 RepID=UPI002815777B|nr:EARP and GARP complex-interacting protein 1 isoform X2 [Mustela nigripes]